MAGTIGRVVLYPNFEWWGFLPPPPTPVPLTGNSAVDGDVVQRTTVIAHNMNFGLPQPPPPPLSSTFSDNAVPVRSAQRPPDFAGFVTPAAFQPRTFPASPEVFVKPVTQQRFPDLAPFGFAATTGPLTFADNTPLFTKPLPAAQQRFPDFVPFGYAATTGPLTFTESPPQFAKPFSVALQRFAQDWVNKPPASIVATPSALVFSESPPQFKAPVRPELQRFFEYGPFFPPVAIFGFSQSPELFAKAFLAGLQRFPDFVPFGAPVAQTPGSLVFTESPPQFKSPLSPTLQRFFELNAALPIAATPGPLVFTESPPRFAAPFKLELQRFEDLGPFFPPVNTWQFSQSPDRFAVPFLASLQRFPDFTSLGPFPAQTPGPFGFAESPPQLRSPFRPELQRFPDLVPFGYAPTTGPLRFTPSPELFAKPFPSTLQRFEDLEVFGFAPTEGPLTFAQSPELFRRPVPAALQRVEDLAVFGFAATTGPFGFSQSPDRFASPFRVELQRFPDLAPFGYAATTGPLDFSPSPERFAKPPVQVPFAEFVPAPTTAILASNNGATVGEAVFDTALVIVHNMQYAAQPIAPPGATPGPFGFSESPPRFITPFPAYLQRFPDFTPQGTIVSTIATSAFASSPSMQTSVSVGSLDSSAFIFVPPTPQGGYSELWSRFARPLAPTQQQFAGFIPPPVVTPSAFASSPNLLRLSAGLGPFISFQSSGAVAAATFTPSTYAELPSRFTPPLAPTTQQFAGFIAPIQVTPSAFASSPSLMKSYSWFEGDNDYTLFPVPVPIPGGFAASPSVVTNFPRFGGGIDFVPIPLAAAAATPSAFQFSESPVRFTSPLAAALQRFGDFAPTPIIVIPPAPPVVPPAGHGSYPNWRPDQPGKRVRPIWDRPVTPVTPVTVTPVTSVTPSAEASPAVEKIDTPVQAPATVPAGTPWPSVQQPIPAPTILPPQTGSTEVTEEDETAFGRVSTAGHFTVAGARRIVARGGEDHDAAVADAQAIARAVAAYADADDAATAVVHAIATAAALNREGNELSLGQAWSQDEDEDAILAALLFTLRK